MLKAYKRNWEKNTASDLGIKNGRAILYIFSKGNKFLLNADQVKVLFLEDVVNGMKMLCKRLWCDSGSRRYA